MSVSFKDMVAQADAQSDHYTLQEDSDDEEKEPGAPPLRTTPGMGPAPHVVSVHSSARQGGCVSQPGDDTSLAGTQPLQQPTCSTGQGQHSDARKLGRQPCPIMEGQCSYTTSRWDRLSEEEKMRKRKVWENRRRVMLHFEIPPFSTLPGCCPGCYSG